MQLDLPFLTITEAAPPAPEPPAAAKPEAVEFVRVRRARRYILRVNPDGTLRVTIPRGGSRAEAIAFMGRNLAWVARERARSRQVRTPVRWTHGSSLLVAGVPHTLEVHETGGAAFARYADREVTLRSTDDLRPDVERDLRAMAAERLIPRLRQLAGQHGLTVQRITIRNQRSRWGSCSRSGTIALNFRLVQMPPAICDYVLIHELMHLKQQNHGPRFWALVERACPGWRDAERWLRLEGRGLF